MALDLQAMSAQTSPVESRAIVAGSRVPSCAAAEIVEALDQAMGFVAASSLSTISSTATCHGRRVML